MRTSGRHEIFSPTNTTSLLLLLLLLLRGSPINPAPVKRRCSCACVCARSWNQSPTGEHISRRCLLLALFPSPAPLTLTHTAAAADATTKFLSGRIPRPIKVNFTDATDHINILLSLLPETTCTVAGKQRARESAQIANKMCQLLHLLSILSLW